MATTPPDIDKVFANDVLKGLSSSPKFLSSRYFYDEKGDAIFQEIMEMPAYYLTGCEREILENKKHAILDIFSNDGRPFQLIEFGAGDGSKTKILLSEFLKEKTPFRYIPIDISENVLNLLCDDLTASMPDLEVEPRQGEYFEALDGLSNGGKTRKIILFLGSNIGNFTPGEVREFLTTLAGKLHKGDLIFIGFDLKKDPELILKAYDDPAGVTKRFNLNLLQRINDELGGNFIIDNFRHFPSYNPVTGEMKSFLLSRKKQEVSIKALEKTFSFEEWEAIYMEVSRKYSLHEINDFALHAGFNPVHNFFDSRHYYTDVIWEVD